MEIIIAILFFSLSSAICLRLFVSAHLLSEKDENLNNALMWSQNLTESFTGCDGRLLMIKNLYPASYLTQSDNESDGSIILYFDDEWNTVDDELHQAAYEAILYVKKEPASEAYKDVNNYGITLTGDSITGNIAILDLRKRTEGFDTIPDDDEFIIFRNRIDHYCMD
ncbi:hypothetical protein SAMN02910398_00662 [Butyrivibrio sp. YAB3001]|nr:hypothetical protein SAMN02910398_00662 [Butyrivibrio sp. YAB3001]